MYYNSVNSVSANLQFEDLPAFNLNYEGASKAKYEDLVVENVETIQDYLRNLGLDYSLNNTIKISVNGINTGPQFRSDCSNYTFRLFFQQ